ncbi:PVC-type heme-binding CxxCH protein [Lacihabitans sp. CS3-21]|uniref:PVC-type heme-binding CxxCH protein n=1 Tax=Lacihabitans sp. CS3-21 TaxID=2487332 RepID=UPI0020CCDAFD|nr:PVC-type heme-binding CxxCH protein [Lacihabitans sp. CS3-21]MCP9745174.1 dehydrogenase [Lacihabitans sp. CS3-21]
MKNFFLAIHLAIFSLLLFFVQNDKPEAFSPPKISQLRIVQDEKAQTISVFRLSGTTPILTQVAKKDFRPYLHPIMAPDGKGVITEYSPGHHKHQTGIYWGYTRVNGRDYFHHPEGDYWRKVSAKIIKAKGAEVKWQTVYDLLDEKGNAVLRETQTWTMQEKDGKYVLNVDWEGDAQTDVTISKYDYGGLFVRMLWREGIDGEVVNAARQKNEKAEGQRAMWVDAGMTIEGRKDRVHVAVFDHPENKGFPQYWRVDGQLGIGPARARTADWNIKKGEVEVIKHQLIVYTGQLNDVEINNMWGEYSGQNLTWALWGIAQKEGRDAKFLSPEEAVTNMTLKDGFKVNTWAAEPMITQPMAFCWDDKGRLWIAENRDYESRGKGFSNAGNSRILILEDTNHDGVADSKKVFLEGIAFPAAMAVGFDGLYLGAPPNLLFVPDKNHDDQADMDDIEVRLTGWGIRDRHETLNSLHWGPDGWLYGCQGFATPSKVRKPVGKGRLYRHKDPFPEDILQGEGVDINGGVWRYHPTKDKFEVVSHGFSNPWGIDYDAKGQLFISACVIPHMWHIIPGGIYHRQGGQHFNPYTYSDIRTIADHSHRSAHGGARVYQSDAFPAEHQGRIFMANIHEHAVLSDILEKKGSGFVAKHGDELLTANNAQWVGFSMEVGPDGGLYVLDWHDADICGQEVVNGETGRVFRIMPKENKAINWEGRYEDLNKMSDKQLVALQTNTSDWHSRRARLILQNRALKSKLDASALTDLKTIFETNSNADYRLRAFWALFITNNISKDELYKSLSDKNEHIRAWAIQMLCEDKNADQNAKEEFVKMAKEDPSAVVRLYLASAIQRVDNPTAWQISEGLALHGEDAEDHNLPKMIWFGLEGLVKENPARAMALAHQAKIPLISNYISRRLVDANNPEAIVSSLVKNPSNQVEILKGMRDGLEGRFDLKAPKNWAGLSTKLKTTKGESATLANQISQRFGDTQASEQQMATLKNKNAPILQRQQAIQSLSLRKREELVAEIPTLLNDPKLRLETIKAISEYDRPEFGKLLVANYNEFTATEKQQAIQTLSSRSKYGWELTQAIKSQKISKRDVPPYAARQLLRVVGSGFIEVWGPIEQEPSLEKSYAKYQRMINDKALVTANPIKGEKVFQTVCGSCHKMYGKGGNIGPELTGSNRVNTDYILFNVLNPSGEIQDDYKLVVVITRDGRTYSGNVISENDRQLTMRIVGQDKVFINKSDIQSREVMPTSLMPVGLFDNMEEPEILDLMKYLKTMKK